MTNATPTNVAALLTPYAATITITDDTAGLSFSSPTYTTGENNQQGATVTVFRSNYTNSAVQVDFFTADGSAAAAVIVGSAVILFDPIFQGLAISLMAGEVASLLLSRMTVPVAYYLTHRRLIRQEVSQ